MRRYVLRLFVVGRSHRSDAAVANLRAICEEDLNGDVDVDIIDVLERPEEAEANKVVATPTLLRVEPPPGRRIVGDLSDRFAVRVGLDIDGTYDEARS